MQRNRNFHSWRAVAQAYCGKEHFLYVGLSAEHVKKNYADAFHDVLEFSEQTSIIRISLEKWVGSFDRGRWVATDSLRIPRTQKQVKN